MIRASQHPAWASAADWFRDVAPVRVGEVPSAWTSSAAVARAQIRMMRAWMAGPCTVVVLRGDGGRFARMLRVMLDREGLPAEVIDADELPERLPSGPVVLIANDVFERWPCDVFEVREGRLFEKLVATDEFVPRRASTYYYGDPAADIALDQRTETEGAFTVPVAALRTIRAARKHDDRVRPLLVLVCGCADRADLLADVCAAEGAQVARGALSQVETLAIAFEGEVPSIAPLQAAVLALADPLPTNLGGTLARLRRGAWDPNLFLALFDELYASIDAPSDGERAAIADAVAQVADLHTDGELDDVPFRIGMIRYALRDWEGALQAFERSIGAWGESADTWANLGLCAIGTGDIAAAVLAFQRAVELDPEHALANRALSYAVA